MAKMKKESDVVKEYLRCINSPYYFATTYLVVWDKQGRSFPLKTALSEKDFNRRFKLAADLHVALKLRRK